MNPLTSRPLAGALSCLLLAVSSLCGQDTANTPYIHDVARDGDGEVWGIDTRAHGGIYRFVDDKWQALPVNGLAGRLSHPQVITRRADGAVVCVWINSDNERFFSVQRGRQTTPPTAVAIAIPEMSSNAPNLFADSKNNVWLTANSPDICRFSADGTASCVHVLTPEEYVVPAPRNDPANKKQSGWSRVLACEDGSGRIWFHSETYYSHYAAIPGALIYDGTTFTSQVVIPPDSPGYHSCALAPKDAGHLWVGIVEDGLYTLDTKSFQLERVPDQPIEARGVQEIFPRGNDWLFVLHGVPSSPLHGVWNLRGGRWEKIADSLDAEFLNGYGWTRIWERGDGGYYLGTQSNGLWWVPDAGSPRRLNWKQNFPLTNPLRLAALSDTGRWVAVDRNAHVWVGKLGELMAQAQAAGPLRFSAVVASYPLFPDARRHLWGLRASDKKTISEWDGEKWLTHPLPTAGLEDSWQRRPMGVDGAQRVWLLDTAAHRSTTLIYDPAADLWQQYDSFEAALEAQAPLGHAAELPVAENTDDLARFGPRGQICYLGGQTTVGWFDGEIWRHWKRNEIHGPEERYTFDGPPFFTAAGILAINIHKETWEYVGENNWKHAAANRPGYADDLTKSTSPRKIDPPPGAVTRTPRSIVLDNQGLCWLTWQQQLYRCRDNLCAPVFQPGEAQPFIDDRRLTSVYIDARGNAFLRSAERNEYLILPPLGPPPRTTLEIVQMAGPDASPDTRTVRVTTDAKPIDSKLHLDWRLDDGAWQPLAVEKSPATITLTAIRNGAHRLEARSFDAALQTDVTPATLDFRVEFDAPAQIAGYIAQLSDPDNARRKEAVLALTHQPDLTVPALRAARAKTSDGSQRWWIDAALQAASAAK